MKKNEIILSILNRFKYEPRFRKRILSLLVLCTIGIFIIFGFGVWGVVNIYQGVKNYSTNSDNQAQISDIKREIGVISKVKTLSCLDKAQSLIDFRPWLENPISKNLYDLKNACFEKKINECINPECQNKKPSNEVGESKNI